MPPEDIDMEYQEQMNDEERELEEEMKDWVKVVHCNECKHKEYCSRSVDMVDPWAWTGTFANVDYCSHGERKENENEGSI